MSVITPFTPPPIPTTVVLTPIGPSAAGGASGGDRKFVALLARSAAAAGIHALFTEVHEDPDKALCDGPCSLSPQMFEDTIKDVLAIRRVLGHEPA